jgi:3-dehydroquinate dehydratase-1
MSASKKTSALPSIPQIVGTIHSPGSLRKAQALQIGDVDVLELRVDHFANSAGRLLETSRDLTFPLIVTVRHPNEGGANSLDLEQRRELYCQFLPVATYLDVELQSVGVLANVMDEARKRGVHVIVSDHHFQSTPSLAKLKARLLKARRAQPDLFKLAATAHTALDLARLFTFFTTVASRQPMSVMGMGPFGKVSRLLFARAGSLLNYGYLHRAQVTGQWEACRLKKRVEELTLEE